MISVEPHKRSIARLSKSAKRRKDNQNRFGKCKGCLSADDKFWRKEMYRLNKTNAKPTKSKRMTGLRVEVRARTWFIWR